MITIPIHTAIVLRGTNVPPQNVEALLTYAAPCGFEVVQTTAQLERIDNLEEYLKSYLEHQERLDHMTQPCLEPYAGLSLLSMMGLTLDSFITKRRHKPYNDKGHCECIRLQSAVLELMTERDLQFTDCNPAAFFVTRIGDSGLAGRPLNFLEFTAGVKWLEQCWYLTHADILQMRHGGPKTIEAIETRLRAKLPARWE